MTFPHRASVGTLIVAIALVMAFSLLRERETPAPAASAADIAAMASSVSGDCAGRDDPQNCMEDAILGLVEPHGPQEAIGVLTRLLSEQVVHGRGDYHDYVHRIGRLTAKKEGLNPEGFFTCPVDFNYGCQHGFFEQALVEEPDPKKAAERVCDASLMQDKPLKFFFYCYHGVGHGILMAKAYDLDASLAICNSFAGHDERTGCYQGVFMENVVGYMKGDSVSGNFSDTNRLAPCDTVAPQYQYQCFINHGGYLAAAAGSGGGAVERATLPCLAASGENLRACLASVGLTATNEAWQPALTPLFDPQDFAGNAVQICSHFPDGYQLDCVLAAIDNLANFDRGDTTRMSDFCATLREESLQIGCFRRIGQTVKNELPAGTSPEQICSAIPEEYRALCISGARL